jgi:hypothetical protein
MNKTSAGSEKRREEFKGRLQFLLEHGTKELINDMDLSLADLEGAWRLEKMGCKLKRDRLGDITTVIPPKNSDKKLLAKVARWQKRHVQVARLTELRREQ